MLEDAFCVKSLNVGVLLHSSKHTVPMQGKVRSPMAGRTPTIGDPDSAALPPAWWDFLSRFSPLDPPSSVKRPGAARGATADGLRHGRG